MPLTPDEKTAVADYLMKCAKYGDQPESDGVADVIAKTTQFQDVAQIAALNKANGCHWFSRDTLSFFNSKTYGSIHHGRYFISSEKYSGDSKRWYTVRRADPDGTIATVSDFQQFATYKSAWAWIDAQVEAGELESFGPSVIDAR